MLSQKEITEYVGRLKLSTETFKRYTKEFGLEAAQIDVNGDLVTIWAKDRIDENVSACHSIVVKDGVVYDHNVSRYNELVGEWEE